MGEPPKRWLMHCTVRSDAPGSWRRVHCLSGHSRYQHYVPFKCLGLSLRLIITINGKRSRLFDSHRTSVSYSQPAPKHSKLRVYSFVSFPLHVMATWTVPAVTSSTNLGPLTSPLTFPDDCLSKFWDFQTPGLQPPAGQSAWSYLTQGCAVTSCCPSSQTYSEAYQWLTSYYSPGVCPHLYKECMGPDNLTPNPGETVAFCCPA